MIDREKIKEAFVDIISSIGDDPNREGLRDTPERVSIMYEKLFSGIHEDPSSVLSSGFQESHEEVVIVRDISFFSICEHHFLPFYGAAHIGYVPNGKVIGASKIARALDILARRPQLQERLTDQIVDAVQNTVNPEGVIALLSASHMCMTIRGVEKTDSKVVTSASRGSFKSLPNRREEFFSLLRGI